MKESQIQLLPLLSEDASANMANYEDDLKKISTIINGLINSAKFKENDRFVFSDKETLKKELTKQIGIYSYADNTKKKLVSQCLMFMSKLGKEKVMPKKFVSNKTDYFNCKLSENWNELKNTVVSIISNNKVDEKLRDRNVK